MPLNGVSAAMRERVSQQLREIERRYDVKVLYACESGSRGWGFASPDSDYDVRFLYVHPLEWYLRVEAPRDVIELPIDDELDVSGWEWRKALGLLKGANPTLIEWLDSPVVYQQDEETITALKAMVPKWFLRCVRVGIIIRWRGKLSRLFTRRRSAAEKYFTCCVRCWPCVGLKRERRTANALC